MNKITKRLSIDHALIHISYQAMAGIIYGFTVYLLLARGFDSATTGLVLAFANIFSLIIQPFVSNFLDKTKKLTVFEVMIITSVLMLTLFFISSIINNSKIVLLVTFTLSIGIYSSLEPLFNSLASVFKFNGYDIEFGKARAFGSLSYALVCTLFGALTNNGSYVVVLIGGCAFALLITLVCIIIRKDFRKAVDKPIIEEEDDTIGFVEFISSNPIYMLLCILLVGVFFGYLGADNFTYLVVENVGGSSSDMGIILGIKAALESIIIFNYSKIRKYFKLKTLINVCMLGFVLKSLTYFLATSTLTIYLAQILQMMSFALIIPTMIEYIETNMKKEVSNRAQAFFTMTIGLGSVISSAIGGVIIDNFGVSRVLFVYLMVTIISAICLAIVFKIDMDIRNGQKN